jgi:hypothetical protein
VTGAQALTVALTEDDVIDAQEMPFGSHPGFKQDYPHPHLLRDVLTAATGNAILGNIATIAPGRIYERTFIYEVKAGWNPDKLHVIAFVSGNDGANKEVVQAAEAKLKQ